MTVAEGTTVGKLRIRASGPDPAALRMRGSSALRTLDLQPASMPRQAILCIRALRDPLPGGVDLRSSHAPRPEGWERAARHAIAAMMRRAVRPALDPVPSDAEAVWFADASELLAYAARAAAGGLLASQWWWEHLVVPRTSAGVVREWMHAPRYVPAAIELLERAHALTVLVRVIAGADAERLIEAVLRAHGRDSVAAAVTGALAAGKVPVGRPAAAASARAAPWREMAAEAEMRALPVEHRVLAVIARMLRRYPTLVSSEEFERQVIAWIEEARGEEERPFVTPAGAPLAAPTSEESCAEAEGEAQGPSRVETGRKMSGVERPALAHAEARVEATQSPLAPQLESPAATQSRPHDLTMGQEQREVEVPARIAPQEEAQSSPHRLLEEHRTEPAIVPPLVPDLVIQSEYAGLFFLLNVFIAMELYSDFTSPVQKGTDCNVWQFLRLVARALMDEVIEEDPVWPFLEALTGDDERSIDADWLDGLVAQIRERLSIFESPDFLIARFARVTTSPAHLDVYFSLPAHPIEIRMAGLDRDPGWMPAASRHVTFHFD